MDTLRIGFAQENITPEPVGFYLDGYGFRNRPADSVRDPLLAQLCVFALLSPAPSHTSRLIQSPCLSFLRHTANSLWLSIYIW